MANLNLKSDKAWGRPLTDDEKIIINQAETLIEQLTVLLTQMNCLETSDRQDNDRPVVHLAEDIAERMLKAAEVDAMCGCPLCRG